jgi:hypothetical protein
MPVKSRKSLEQVRLLEKRMLINNLLYLAVALIAAPAGNKNILSGIKS